MLISLTVCIALLACCSAYFYHKLKKEHQLRIHCEEEIKRLLAEKIESKDLKFLEFSVDMYIKYAKDLNIYSESQHEFIVKELERIRDQHLISKI